MFSPCVIPLVTLCALRILHTPSLNHLLPFRRLVLHLPFSLFPSTFEKRRVLYASPRSYRKGQFVVSMTMFVMLKKPRISDQVGYYELTLTCWQFSLVWLVGWEEGSINIWLQRRICRCLIHYYYYYCLCCLSCFLFVLPFGTIVCFKSCGAFDWLTPVLHWCKLV